MDDWTLRADQIEDLSYFMQHPKAVNCNEPGCGKTPVVCVLQRWLWDTKQVATVWVMPLSLLKKNRDEAMRFGGWENEDDIVIVHGTPKQVDEQLKKPAKVFLMGFARFKKVWEVLPERFKAFHADEFHMGFGGNDSASSMAMYGFMKKQGEWFLPMTGTLVNGKLDTAYPALQVIEPRYYGTFDAFKNFHHEIDLWTGKRTGYRNHAHLGEIISLHGTRRKWSDIFGDEDKVVEPEIVMMEPEQLRLYKEFEANAILELEQFFIDGTMPGVAFARARQIMECPNEFPDLRFPDTNKSVDIIPGRRAGKTERVELHLIDHQQLGTPFVVFSAVRRQQVELWKLATKLGMDVGLINGATSPKDRAIQDEAFRAGHLQGLIVSPKVASVGFNWQFWGDKGVEVSHAIFASLDYVDTTFFQAYRRFMRQTRKTPLRISVLKYHSSLDFRICQLLNQKSADAKLVDPSRELLSL